MGMQQLSGGMAHRLRSSCILPHFSAVTVLASFTPACRSIHSALTNPHTKHFLTNKKINNKKKEETHISVQIVVVVRK
jgi:hypothetical protein